MAEGQPRRLKLEDLQAKAAVRGVLADSLVTVVSVQWFGPEAVELTYKTPAGKVANELPYRDESRLESGLMNGTYEAATNLARRRFTRD